MKLMLEEWADGMHALALEAFFNWEALAPATYVFLLFNLSNPSLFVRSSINTLRKAWAVTCQIVVPMQSQLPCRQCSKK